MTGPFEDEPDKPEMINVVDQDFGPLRKLCQSYIDELAKEGKTDDDLIHYVFEVAIEACFGEDAWKWINNAHRSHSG